MELLKANIGSILRLVLGILGGCGVVISSEQTDSIIQAVGQIVSGISILIPVIWAIVKNWRLAKASKK